MSEKRIYANGVSGVPGQVGDMVCAEHPESLNQIVGQLISIDSYEHDGTYYGIRLDGGSELTIRAPIPNDKFGWRIKKIHDDEEWHPRQSSAIELRQRYSNLTHELMDMRQDLEWELHFGSDEQIKEAAMAIRDRIVETENAAFKGWDDKWRGHYMKEVASGWE